MDGGDEWFDVQFFSLFMRNVITSREKSTKGLVFS